MSQQFVRVVDVRAQVTAFSSRLCQRNHILLTLLTVGVVGFFVALGSLSVATAATEAHPLAGVDDASNATIVVNNLGDTSGMCTTTGTGMCTLRDAIVYANSHAGADNITFNTSGAISLTATLPAINDGVTIDGSGRSITISGNSAVRALIVNSGKHVTLNALTIANGIGTVDCVTYSCGGGILSSGMLTITNSTFSGNSAYGGFGGGIYNSGGTVTVNNSTFSGNSSYFGGDIYNSGGTVTVNNSTFSGNSSLFGGSINNAVTGTLTIANSTFGGNSAPNGGVIYNGGALILNNSTLSGSGNSTGVGGGIYNDSTGTLTIANSTITGNNADLAGGIHNSGTLTITNSTISGNSARNAGGIHNSGTLTAINSTFSGNNAGYFGGGIHNNGGTVTLKNTIVANSPNGGDCYSPFGSTLTADAYNLADDNTCDNATQKTSAQINLAALALNGNDGGTQTLALLPGSAAIDAGNDTVCSAAPVNNLDQRSVLRPLGAHCDVGAYEFAVGVTNDSPTVLGNATTFTTTVNVTPPFTLALSFGDSSPTTAENLVLHTYGAAGVYTATVTASNAQGVFTATSPVTICGSNTVLNTNDGGTGSLRLIVACALPNATIIFDPTLANQTITLTTGEIPINKALTIDGSTAPGVRISGNNASRVFNVSAPFSLKTLTIQDGHANGDGGGIYSTSTLTLTKVSFLNNSAYVTANDAGGALYIGGSGRIVNALFANNISTYGDDIYLNTTGTVQILHTTIAHTTPHYAAIHVANGTMVITNTIFANDNTAIDYTSGTVYENYNLFYGNATNHGVGANDVYGNPKFVNPGGNDYHIGMGSAAIDTGINVGVLTDRDGNVRPMNYGFDIGAYEYQGVIHHVNLPLIVR